MKYLLIYIAFTLIVNKEVYSQGSNIPESIKEFVDRETNFVNSKGIGSTKALVLALIKSASTNILNDVDSDVKDIHLQHLANRLSLLGFNPGNITSLNNQGISVLDAALAGPNANLTQQSILSEFIAEIRISSIDREDLNDGYSFTINCEVDVMYKPNQNRKNIEIRLRGHDVIGDRLRSNEWQPALGERYIVLVSYSLYEFYSSLGNRQGEQGKNYALLQWNPIQILNNGEVLPVLPSPISDTATYNDVIQQIRAGIKYSLSGQDLSIVKALKNGIKQSPKLVAVRLLT